MHWHRSGIKARPGRRGRSAIGGSYAQIRSRLSGLFRVRVIMLCCCCPQKSFRQGVRVCVCVRLRACVTGRVEKVQGGPRSEET